ncbi:DUF3592 domain-containing protein [Nocardia bovistercoris]|uniref:DUF3592 domain-containing protein n=1 Tax=Nocardia bovistercoris TaxID=2785916 RepID=A0A931IGM8_9NOCA|nr:DUF3592 domain-containing protein [Nocardia bovistercoris]
MHGFWDYVGLVVVVLFGVAQFSIGVGLLRQTIERAVLWLGGHRARGTITSFAEESDSEGHRIYRPAVEFTAATGEHRHIALADTVMSRPRVGARITVVYRPSDPEHVDALGIAKGIGSLVAFPILVVVGVAAIVLPIAYLLGFDGVLTWSEQAAGDTIDWLDETLGGALGSLQEVLAKWFG